MRITTLKVSLRLSKLFSYIVLITKSASTFAISFLCMSKGLDRGDINLPALSWILT
jgi:hypothetical protein